MYNWVEVYKGIVYKKHNKFNKGKSNKISPYLNSNRNKIKSK
jgi:hypothetical protein